MGIVALSKTVGRTLTALAVAALTAGMSVASGCASTEFYPEGPGQAPDKTKGTVPAGAVGACRRPQTKKPAIVNPSLWEHTPVCNARTPDTFIRLGYGREGDVEADKQSERILQTLSEGSDQKEGNNKMLTMVRGLQDWAVKQPTLRDRVTRESSRPMPCDFTYMLNAMVQERQKLEPNDACTAHVYDVKDKTNVCLFDMNAKGVAWLTSSYDCMTRVSPAEAQSCHQLCAYDDYCVRQVSCTATDIDLMLCAAGVCLPEPRTGIY